MSYRFVTLDVFTEARFEGNPLAIVHVPANSALTQDQKQAIAREFNLSETVFLHEDDRSAARRLDIFLPTVEIPFAGTANPFFFRAASMQPFSVHHPACAELSAKRLLTFQATP